MMGENQSGYILEVEHCLNQIVMIFCKLTNLEVDVKYIQKGANHRSSKLEETQQGVYVFCTDVGCLKVGYAGIKTQKRWSSNHYTTPLKADKKTKNISLTNSTLSKSLVITKEDKKIKFIVSDSTKSMFDPDILKELEHISESVCELRDGTYDNYKKQSRALSKKIRRFIQDHTHRFELKILAQNNINAIALLEKLVIFYLNPLYEGE